MRPGSHQRKSVSHSRLRQLRGRTDPHRSALLHLGMSVRTQSEARAQPRAVSRERRPRREAENHLLSPVSTGLPTDHPRPDVVSPDKGELRDHTALSRPQIAHNKATQTPERLLTNSPPLRDSRSDGIAAKGRRVAQFAECLQAEVAIVLTRAVIAILRCLGNLKVGKRCLRSWS